MRETQTHHLVRVHAGQDECYGISITPNGIDGMERAIRHVVGWSSLRLTGILSNARRGALLMPQVLLIKAWAKVVERRVG